VLVAIVLTSLATLVSSYFYLANGGAPDANPIPPATDAIAATIVAIVAGTVTRWLTFTIDRGQATTRRWPLLVTLGLFAALAWMSVSLWQRTGLDAAASGYASSVLGLLGFAGLMAVGAAGMLLAAVVWAFRKAEDPRGRGVAFNASLMCYSTAATWLVTVAIVYGWPRVGG
jgi:heme/copper-type cytochrome/quinol oxidase subunit 3